MRKLYLITMWKPDNNTKEYFEIIEKTYPAPEPEIKDWTHEMDIPCTIWYS